jgi:hypothetical protein
LSLRRKEWLEKVLHRLIVHTYAGIGNSQQDILTSGSVPHLIVSAGGDLGGSRRNLQLPPVRHRIAGVHGQIHDDLPDLVGIRHYRRAIRVQGRDQPHVFPDHALEHSLGLLHHRANIRGTGPDRLPPAERQ